MPKVLLLFALCLACHAHAFDHSHAAWTGLLHKYVVVNGPLAQVKYAEFKEDEAVVNKYTHTLTAVSPAEFDGFSQEQKMAFLINAYNAFTVTTILQHYPVKSIKDIGSVFKSTWKIKFFKLLGQDMNLDEIEHENLRRKFKEPRVHFALNCASVGCPALRNEAFEAERLNAQLDEQAKLFLRDSSRNKIDVAASKLELSMIFKWFHEDFERDGGSVQKFVANYVTDDSQVKAKLQAGAFALGYLEYNWNLNKAGN